jgi:hypothetical protein
MTDFSHLNAIQDRIHREEMRLRAANTENERRFREHEIMMAKREEAAEYKFLGIEPQPVDEAMSIEEILSELNELFPA